VGWRCTCFSVGHVFVVVVVVVVVVFVVRGPAYIGGVVGVSDVTLPLFAMGSSKLRPSFACTYNADVTSR
jgi:hypothetical protein